MGAWRHLRLPQGLLSLRTLQPPPPDRRGPGAAGSLPSPRGEPSVAGGQLWLAAQGREGTSSSEPPLQAGRVSPSPQALVVPPAVPGTAAASHRTEPRLLDAGPCPPQPMQVRVVSASPPGSRGGGHRTPQLPLPARLTDIPGVGWCYCCSGCCPSRWRWTAHPTAAPARSLTPSSPLC